MPSSAPPGARRRSTESSSGIEVVARKGDRVRLRAVRVVTTLPLLAGAALAWWFQYEVLAIVAAIAGVLLAVLQWMTVRALAHNAPEPGDSLADRGGRSV